MTGCGEPRLNTIPGVSVMASQTVPPTCWAPSDALRAGIGVDVEAVGIRLFLPRLLLELGRLTSSSCPQTGVYTIGSPSFSGLGIRTALPHWLSGTGCRRQITVPLSHQGHVIQFLTTNLLVCPSTPMCLSMSISNPYPPSIPCSFSVSGPL